MGWRALRRRRDISDGHLVNIFISSSEFASFHTSRYKFDIFLYPSIQHLFLAVKRPRSIINRQISLYFRETVVRRFFKNNMVCIATFKAISVRNIGWVCCEKHGIQRNIQVGIGLYFLVPQFQNSLGIIHFSQQVFAIY